MSPTTRVAALVSLPFLFFTTSAAANSLERDQDPVVLTGLEIPAMLGEDPGAIVAFRYEATWVPIPVQVDEREVRDFGAPYDTTAFGVTSLFYTDDSTFTGADSDTTFDADDELVFMARDAGDVQAPLVVADPAGVRKYTRIELAVTNPINAGTAYVYLFVTDGSLPQHANQDYVGYNFGLASGAYKDTYNLLSGPNPEDSEVTTDFYRTHFSDRWIRDEVNVKAGDATEVDILDRHKNLFAPGICIRSEDTFSAGEGCFVANIDGPVRAIRSYLGANSGPFTQRVHVFYERRHDVATYLRVHSIFGVMDFYDYSPAADSMVYTNDFNTAGVTIDGSMAGDTVTAGPVAWEMVTGVQGTLVMAEAIDTDIPDLTYTSYYSDDSTPSATQCTGDSAEYGASGAWITDQIPNTDPYLGPHSSFVVRRTVYYEEPNQPVSLAYTRHAQATIPFTIGVTVGITASAAAPIIQLRQNVPNPFSGSTAIEYVTPNGTEAQISVYDVAGRLVTRLRGVDGRVTWDGVAASGRRAPSGIYFYRIDLPGHGAVTKKMVLLH